MRRHRTITFNGLVRKLGVYRSIENAPSRNNCGTAPNQFIFTFEHGRLLQSYQTPVAAWVDGQLYLSFEHDCSGTTNRFVKQFTNLSKSERNKGIENGTIRMFTIY